MAAPGASTGRGSKGVGMMRTAERKELLRVKAMILSGDRAGALASIRTLTAMPRQAQEFAAVQLVLRLVIESEPVECRIGGTMALRTCLTLRSRLWPSGNRKGCMVNIQCDGCPLGVEYAKRLPGWVPPPQTQAPEVMPAAQRKARDRARQA